MRKPIAFVLLMLLTVSAVSGCGVGPGLNIVRKIPLPEPYMASVESASPEAAAEQADDAPASPQLSEGTIKSLDELKEKAAAAGYEVIEMLAMQESEETVGGFDVIIKDTFVPVMEFKTPDDAQAFAEIVIEAGYNVPIVNGRFFTIVGAERGKIRDPEMQAALEAIMDAKAQVKDS